MRSILFKNMGSILQDYLKMKKHKNFDSVKSIREMRNKLAKGYLHNLDQEKEDLKGIRQKYRIDEKQ